MPSVRQSTVMSYKTSAGGQDWLYDVFVDQNGLASVRNFRGPNGLIADSQTSVPQQVMDDMQEAILASRLVLQEVVADQGTVTFTGETSKDVVVANGALNNTNYRVVYSPPDGTILRTTGKLATGFTAETAAAYGTVQVPKVVGYVVLVATAQASTSSGTLNFVQADAGQKAVLFSVALPTDKYRVILSPGGFHSVRVINQTRRGFTVQLGHLLGQNQTATVGYDVFGGFV